MNSKSLNNKMMNFINSSPTCFHVVENIASMLSKSGFTRLYEGEKYSLQYGKKYFVTRNDSSLIAFCLPESGIHGFQIISSHSDSPCFKIKANAEIESGKYIKLNTEKYGGMLCSTWLDRPLSVAGRVIIKTGNGIETKLVNVDKNLLFIPNLAIHMNRKANDGFEYSAQTDMLPILGSKDSKDSLIKNVCKTLGIKKDAVLDMDLFLYNRELCSIVGADDDFIAGPRLDDLQCAFSSLMGFLEADVSKNVQMYCIFDNEEVGSTTKQGAASTFLKDTLYRIADSLNKSEGDLLVALQNSFMISADNAHSVHPNHPEKADPVNRPVMNNGIVIKYSANQKYTTDAVSGAIMKEICNRANVPVQIFVNNSDVPGGSTLGNISNTQVSLNTVDIGLAQLAMHSAYELAGAKDAFYLASMAKTFYSLTISSTGNGTINIK